MAHAIDIEWVKEACRRTRKDGAAGVDGFTWADYAKDLDANLSALPLARTVHSVVPSEPAT